MFINHDTIPEKCSCVEVWLPEADAFLGMVTVKKVEQVGQKKILDSETP
jgi:hypothetical protein